MTTADSAKITRDGSGRKSAWRRLMSRPTGIFSAGVLVVLAVCAMLPTSILPHDPTMADSDRRFLPPAFLGGGSSSYLLGTDALGRDIFSMLVAGSRFTLLIVIGAGLVSLILGVLVGLVAGFYRGWLDTVFMRFADIQLAFPALVLVIAVVAAFGPSIRNLILILGFVGWAPYARLVRGTVLSLRERGYVQAAVATGIGNRRILLRHLLPNASTSIAVFFTSELAALVILEASLSFLGLGVQPPNPSWGAMIADGRQYMSQAWWATAIPGALIVVIVLAFNFLGDELRDILDPALRER